MKKQWKIGFDAKRIVRNGTGLGSYSRTLVNALSALRQQVELLLYAPDMGKETLRKQVEVNDNMRFVYPQPRLMPFYKQWWRSKGIVADLQRDGVELFHGLSGELPVGLKAAQIPALVTIHDLIFMRHPEYYHWWDVMIYTRKFKQTLREADRIVAISERTKYDIMAFGDFTENRIEVIYQSCSTRFRQPATAEACREATSLYRLPSRYCLFVGTVEARKNALLAVKALPHLPSDLHLVIVGRHTAYAEKIKKYIHQHRLAHRVHFLQGVPNEHLPAIYQQAEVFVYPSRYEGFGLPIIEAIQSGLPVVACTGSCLEEAGGPYNLYVHPDDTEGMAAAIGSLIENSVVRHQIVEKSKEYIERFENKDTAQRMMKVYEKMLKKE